MRKCWSRTRLVTMRQGVQIPPNRQAIGDVAVFLYHWLRDQSNDGTLDVLIASSRTRGRRLRRHLCWKGGPMGNTAKTRIARVIASTVAIIVIVAEYRSLVDNRPFPQSFDTVIRAALAACWQLVTSPIVLTALVIFAILYLGRQPVLLYLRFVDEFRAGMLSARVNTARVEVAVARTVSDSGFATAPEPSAEPAKISESPPTASAEVQGVISRIPVAVCRFFLKVSDRTMSVDNLIRTLGAELGPLLFDPTAPEPYRDSIRYVQAAGYFQGLTNLTGFMYAQHMEWPDKESLPLFKIVLDPSVERLLIQRTTANAPRASATGPPAP